MARPARPWFRLYVETVYDLKLRRQPPDVRWVWVAVLASARQSPRPGHLLVSERIPMTVEDLAEVAAVSTETAAKAIDIFIEADMLHRDDESRMAVVNWASRQFESDSGKGSTTVPSTERPRNKDGTRTEPPSPDTETESEENPSVGTADDGFADFWDQYPPRDGKKLDKGKAQAAWKRMSKRDRAAAMVGVGHYAASGQRAKDAFRWLRDSCWDDWQTPAAPDRADLDQQVTQYR
jgi:hypothetical protein